MFPSNSNSSGKEREEIFANIREEKASINHPLQVVIKFPSVHLQLVFPISNTILIIWLATRLAWSQETNKGNQGALGTLRIAINPLSASMRLMGIKNA